MWINYNKNNGSSITKPERLKYFSHGFQPVVKEKVQARFGGIFDGVAENHDKTINAIR